MKRPCFPFLAAAAILVASGCSTLDNAARVESKFPAEAYTAKLKFDGKFEVVRINGRLENSRMMPQEMKLVPGQHELELITRDHGLEGSGTIPLNVAEGQVLELTSYRDGVSLNVEIWEVTDHNRDRRKLATYAMDLRASTDRYRSDQANNDTNGNRPLQ